MANGSDQFDLSSPIVVVIVAFVLVIILALIFYLSRYRKFTTNQYVIHFRNGKVKKAGTGGRVFLLPVFDQIVVIPTTVQQTLLEAREQVVSYEYQDVSLTAYIYWRVVDPSSAFGKVSFDHAATDYVEKVIKNASESIIRTTCAKIPVEMIIRERGEIIKKVTSELHTLVNDWGLTIESVEIVYVEVLNQNLKTNLEKVKQLEEEQTARLRAAEMEEITQLRNLEVQEKTGTSEQHVKLAVEQKAKERQIRITQLEQERAIVEADTGRKTVEINAEAEKFRRLQADVEVEVQSQIRHAEARKIELLAEAEGEAARVKQKLLAEAEGILEQAKALSESPDNILQLRVIESLPEIFRNIKVDRMMLLGEGQDAYKSLAQLVLPFAEIAREISQNSLQGKKGTAKSK
ncbi:MAG: SPFH domain-containing protein [Candidatus Heimdallarchaeota archaeon]